MHDTDTTHSPDRNIKSNAADAKYLLNERSLTELPFNRSHSPLFMAHIHVRIAINSISLETDTKMFCGTLHIVDTGTHANTHETQSRCWNASDLV